MTAVGAAGGSAGTGSGGKGDEVSGTITGFESTSQYLDVCVDVGGGQGGAETGESIASGGNGGGASGVAYSTGSDSFSEPLVLAAGGGGGASLVASGGAVGTQGASSEEGGGAGGGASDSTFGSAGEPFAGEGTSGGPGSEFTSNGPGAGGVRRQRRDPLQDGVAARRRFTAAAAAPRGPVAVPAAVAPTSARATVPTA